ncbi:MAG: hypothetical protein QNJ81_06755 [Acidimicrobiia bacterium]|nr:hypothetical protein [Acidimicrobiia bacterium]
MIYCSTFVNAAAFRDHFLQLRLDTPESEQRATVMRIFGPSFFSLYDCKRFDKQINAFGLRRLGEVARVHGAVKFFPDFESLKPNEWALKKTIDHLTAYHAVFNPDTTLDGYFTKILFIPKANQGENIRHCLKIMNANFAHRTFSIVPGEVMGREKLTTIVDDERHRIFVR